MMANPSQPHENLLRDATQERTFALEVVQQLRSAGHQALWAGGCVRDLLLGGQPEDYDVATSATPKQVRELFGHKRTLPVGMSFGVVIVLAPSRSEGQVEVATFRTDASYSDGRRPDSVTFSTAVEDAQRRDFTINGMFYDPILEEVIDYVGGQADLREGVIRAIGRAEDRISEDKLRMLRAIRFAARFEFSIEPATRAAIRDASQEVRIVSGERIAIELQKTLQTQRAAWAMREWMELGLLQAVLPEVVPRWSDGQPRITRMLDAKTNASWQGKLSLLLFVSLPTEDREYALSKIRSRLKLSNADVQAMRCALTSQELLEQAEQLPWSIIQPRLIDPNIQFALELMQARLSDGLSQDRFSWVEQRLALPIGELDPQPLMDGGDLIALGIQPGPRFKQLLARARAMQLDGELADRESAVAWAQRSIKREP